MPATLTKPRPKKKKTARGFSFDQLSKSAKRAAIEAWRESQIDMPCDGLADLLETDLEDYFGITHCKLYYSLGYCQGDGVAFEGSPDLATWAGSEWEKKHGGKLGTLLLQLDAMVLLCGTIEPSLRCEIKHTDSHYCHWNSMDVTVENHEYWFDDQNDADSLNVPVLDGLNKLLDEIQSYCDEAAKDISRELERIGYAQIEEEDCDEYIAELLEANDYRFNREGEIL